MTVMPFTVHIPQETLDDLGDRLGRTRWPDEVEGAAWDYGTNLAYVQALVAYWRASFDWRAQEADLNRFTHFRTELDGLGIHFIHERGAGPHPLPLLLVHGWPSSFLQMRKILPLLTDPAAYGGDAADAFDVVVPSLPGFGLSDRPTQRGMSVGRIAELFHILMTRELGYAHFATRGGDLGAGVIGALALAYPEVVVGVHSGGTNPWIQQVPNDLSEAERTFVQNAQKWNQQEMAYAQLHATKPQTVAYGLNDSPAGLAAWIIEKFRRWSDCDGDVERRFTRDELLANLTIYWATQTINSSMRLYYETLRDPGGWGQPRVPTAALMSSKDMFPTPRAWAERTGKVDRWTEIDRGGHFLEWEEPELVAQDLRAFYRPLRAGPAGGTTTASPATPRS